MPQDFEKPGESPADLETLLTAFYNESAPEANRAGRLWQSLEPRLKASPVQPGRSGGRFGNFQQKWNFRMKNETPLLERESAGYAAEKTRRGNRVGSLLGGLAALVLVLGLVAVFALNAGKGPSVNSGAGGQPVATNTVPSDLQPTPTPVPYDSRAALPLTADPRATATPLPYTTPDGSPRPTPTIGPEPTFDPNATATPLPFNGETPVQASGNAGSTSTPAPFQPTVTTPPETVPPALSIPGTDLGLTGFADVPVNYDYGTLPAEIRATNPKVNFYASKDSPVAIEGSLKTALEKAGYNLTEPFATALNNGEPLPPGGVFIFATKAGQPDLHLNLVSIGSAEEVTKLSKTAYFSGGKDFENTVNAIRVKGYSYLMLVISGNNLLEVLSGGSDPGAGAPVGTPTPVK